ncbi:HDIG domain-containing protein [bacterium]|nr:HDIG domain-containing protein [bacterium]
MINKFNFSPNINNFFESSAVRKIFLFFAFTVVMTIIIASQNFFFQNIIENGVSKKKIEAQKTLTVIDSKRTEQRKKDVAQKIAPVLTPAEDEFIKNNLQTLQTAIVQIRKKEVPDNEKKADIDVLLDLSGDPKKDFILNFLLKADENSLYEAFDKANLTLSNILRLGITEQDYESNNIEKIITKNLVSNVSKRQVAVINAILEQVIVPNLVVDELATEMERKNAQNSIKPYEVTFQKGEAIVNPGDIVTPLKRDALRQAGYNVYELNFQGLTAIFILVFIGTFLFLSYMRYFEKDYLESGYLSIMAFLSIAIALIAVLMPIGTSPYLLPLPAFLILSAIFTKPRIAFISSSILLSVMTIGFQYNVQYLAAFILLSLLSVIAVSQIRYSERVDLIKTGFYIGASGVIVLLSIYILEKCLIDVSGYMIVKNCGYIFINSIISAILASGSLPLFEKTFKIITPYGMAELGDHNQKLLKRLQMEAPGTYHHSLMVSSLCEAGAEAIGADPILSRVGALYHDVGKLERPMFFVENQSYFLIENPHNRFAPKISKMIITAHPKDGIKYAKEYGLPSVIQNFILQHHGEGLASYFYNQAVKEEGAENVKEEQYRYPGPKPNMKETAILMIADAVESAVRSLKSPTTEEIDAMINKIIIERLNDGQLSDSPLTLKDLNILASTFSRILRGMQHNRIKYQENLPEEIQKINMPAIDTDLENKIKQLEEQPHKEENND